MFCESQEMFWYPFLSNEYKCGNYNINIWISENLKSRRKSQASRKVMIFFDFCLNCEQIIALWQDKSKSSGEIYFHLLKTYFHFVLCKIHRNNISRNVKLLIYNHFQLKYKDKEYSS